MCLIISHACISNYRKLSVQFYAYFNDIILIIVFLFYFNSTAHVIFSLVLTHHCQLCRVYFSTSLNHFFASKRCCLGSTRSVFPYQQQRVNAERSLEDCAVR